jgi:hypothetical protein
MLENALKSTKLIDWSKSILSPCVPDHVFECIRRVSTSVNIVIEPDIDHPPHHLVLYAADSPPFENIR